MKTFTFPRMSIRGIVRTAAATAIGVGVLVPFAAPVLAASSAAKFERLGAGYAVVWRDAGSERGAGEKIFSVEGNEVHAYCIEFLAELNETASYSTKSLSDTTVNGAASAAWLAVNHETVGTPHQLPDSEAAATQLAVWMITDSLKVNDATVGSPSIRARALELAAAANGKALDAGPSGFDLTVAADTTVDEATFTATLKSDKGAALEGETVTFKVAGNDIEATTNASGAAQITVPAPKAGVELEAAASWAGVLPAGTVLAPENAADQELVTTTTVEIIRQAAATVTGISPPASTPTTVAPTTVPQTTIVGTPAPPVEPPATTTTQPTLPFTGGTFGFDQMIVGLGFLAAAGFGAWKFRMRRALS